MVEIAEPRAESEERESRLKVASGVYIPTNIVANSTLERDLDEQGILTRSGRKITRDEIYKKALINQRHHVRPHESEPATGDYWVPLMGQLALEESLQKKRLSSVDELNYLFVSTSYPLSRPVSEMIYQRVKRSKNPTIPPSSLVLKDCYAACSGFAWWFHYINENRDQFTDKKIAIVASEQMSAHVVGFHKALFGDGAGALIFTPGEELEILGTSYQYFPDQAPLIKMRQKKLPDRLFAQDPFVVPLECPRDGEPDFVMDEDGGKKVFRHAIDKANLALAINACSQAGLTWKDLSFIILHQGNGRITQNIEDQVRRLGFTGQMPGNIESLGNTSSASVPLLLNQLIESGEIKPGEPVLLWAFGAGMTSTAAIVKFL